MKRGEWKNGEWKDEGEMRGCCAEIAGARHTSSGLIQEIAMVR